MVALLRLVPGYFATKRERPQPFRETPTATNLRLISITYLIVATMLYGRFDPLFTVQTPKCKLLHSRYVCSRVVMV
jgi:hypothetical protein